MINEKWSHKNAQIQFSNPTVKPMEEHTRLRTVEDTSHFYYDVEVTNEEQVLMKFFVNDSTVTDGLPEAVDRILTMDMSDPQNVLLLENIKEEDYEREVRYARVNLQSVTGLGYGVTIERYDSYWTELDNSKTFETKYDLTLSHFLEVVGGEKRDISHVESIGFQDVSVDDLKQLKEMASRFVAEALDACNLANGSKLSY